MKYRRSYRELNPGNLEYKAELRFKLKAKFVKFKHENKLSVSVKYYLDGERSQFIFNFGPDGLVESGRRGAALTTHTLLNTERLFHRRLNSVNGASGRTRARIKGVNRARRA